MDFNHDTGTISSILVLDPGTQILTVAGTTGLLLPSGNTAERGSSIAGQMRYNTDLSIIEGFDGNIWTTSSVDIPSVLANSYAYTDAALVGTFKDRGYYDASSNLWPSTGGSGSGGAIIHGDVWFISVPGTLGGNYLTVGTTIVALVDNPLQVNSNWNVLSQALNYTPENVANKNASNGYAGLYGYNIQLSNSSGTLNGNIASLATSPQIWSMPNNSGTVALLSDITSGTVLAVNVVTVNGFAGTVVNPTTLANISIRTTVTGIVKGNGTALSAATADVDYLTPGTASADYEPKNSNIQAHIASTSNPHVTTAAQVGAVAVNGAITPGTNTKITYDAKGLVTAGVAATTADINDSTNRRYVLDTELAVLANTSGINTGNQDVSSFVANTTTVNGHPLTNNVTVTKGDVGLGNVDNTSDATKNSANVSLTNHTISNALNTILIANNQSWSGYGITNLADPLVAQDAATKAYVDSSATGLQNKTLTGNTIATTTTLSSYTYYNGPGNDGISANITLTSTGNLTIDSYQIMLNDYVLVKNELAGNAAYNGYYQCTIEGNIVTAAELTRTTNVDTGPEFIGAYIFVNQGNVNAFTGWNCTNTGTVTVGTTSIAFAQFSSAGMITAGTGITVTGTTVSVDHTVVPFKSDDLSVFAATTSAQLASVISDETGSNKLVFSEAPSIANLTLTGTQIHTSEGDQEIVSNDASPFRMGSWATVASGALYTLCSDYVMHYWTHNVPISAATGDFLGRDDGGECTLWAFTEASIIKVFTSPPDTAGNVPVIWNLIESFNTTTGDRTVTGNISGATLLSPTIANFTNAVHDHSTAAKGGNIPLASIVNPQYTGPGTASLPLGTFNQAVSANWSTGVVGSSFGIVTANTSVSVDVTTGGYALRPTNSDAASLEGVVVPALANYDLTSLLAIDDVYVYLTWTTGAAYQFSNTDPDLTNSDRTVVKLAEVHTNQTFDGIDAIHDIRRFVNEDTYLSSIVWDEMLGTIVSGQSCTTSGLYPGITAGYFFSPGNNIHTVNLFDTTGADRFTYWYSNGAGGWTTVSNVAIFDTDHYDDGTGILGNVAVGEWKHDWVLRDLNGNVDVLYGQHIYTNEGAARSADFSTVNKPARLTEADHCYLLGFSVMTQGATTVTCFDQANRILPVSRTSGEFALLNQQNQYVVNGDQDVRSADSSHYRVGTWAITPSGDLYNLVGDYVMQYWSHNFPIDSATGNFLGREEAEIATLNVFTESGQEITYSSPAAAAGSIPTIWNQTHKVDTNTGSSEFSGNVSYLTEGDQQILSKDISPFRTGSFSITASGDIYTLLGDYAMWYWIHNSAVDAAGNFLGRGDGGECSLWVFTESALIKWYMAPPASPGSVPVWQLVNTFNALTGDQVFTGNTTIPNALVTTINKVTITPPSTSATLTIDDGKTLTVTGNASISGTNTGNETTSTIGTLIAGATNKTSFVGADLVPVTNSASSNIVEHVTWTNFAAQFVSAQTFGTANQLFGVNTAGSGQEYKTLSGSYGLTVSPTSGNIVLTNTGVTSFNTRLGNITLTSGDVTGALGFTPVSNLTGPITSVGNATSIALQTGTGTTFAMNASPTFTGTPLSTTAAVDTNTTQIATTAFVVGQAGTALPANVAANVSTVGSSLRYSRQDHAHALGAVGSGRVLQTVSSTIAAASGTSTVTLNNSTPTTAVGTQIVSLSITPIASTSKVRFSGSFLVDNSTSGRSVWAFFFRGSTCIGTSSQYVSNNGQSVLLSFQFTDSPATTSSTAYTIRVAEDNTGTWYVNQSPNGPYFNGTMALGTVSLMELL